MKLAQLRTLLDESLHYPTDVETVTETIGDVNLDAPGGADPRSIGSILVSLQEARFDSADELFSSIYASLPDGYVGRKYYSDRGGHVDAQVDSWDAGYNRSF